MATDKKTIEEQAQRIASLEKLLNQNDQPVPVHLKGTFKDSETNKIWKFKTGYGHKILIKGEVLDKNEVIKNEVLMTYIIFNKSSLIEEVSM